MEASLHIPVRVTSRHHQSTVTEREEKKQEKMQEKKRTKAKKGTVAVVVGLEDVDGGTRRFVIPISYLCHPEFGRLLEAAREVYGYGGAGPLKLPVSVDDFLHLRWLIERESSGSDVHRQSLLSRPAASSFPLSSC